MDFTAEPVFVWLSQYAYQPGMVYSLIFMIMIAGAFGLPVPEEIAIISLGVLAYMAGHPDKFPPPPGATWGIDTYEAAVICFIAVVISDSLVFFLGRFFGPKLLKVKIISRLVTPDAMKKIEEWTAKYGVFAAGVFRFTPGLRFPGFWACGMTGLKPWKFLAVDGFAALISVPTQVILVAKFGEPILATLKEVKTVVFSLLLIVAIIFILRKLLQYRKKRKYETAA